MTVLEAHETKQSNGVNISNMLKDVNLDNVGKFSIYAYTIQMKFTRFVIGISPNEDTVFINKNDIDDEEIIEFLDASITNEATVENFAVAKYYLEKLFYDNTTRGQLEFTYRNSYLLSSSELSKKMKVSRATIMRYVANGMEKVEGAGHRCYPKHDAFYWKDGVWSLRIQALQEQFKVRNRTDKILIKEISEQIEEYEKLYGGKLEEVFEDVISGETNIYDLKEPDDYKDWLDLINDLDKVRGKIN
ncbi:hypothetical protein [Oceanobacillus sp. Castelsardo]|uniref:hypothetical protein n=1 Tax=Oceanobacillus sp. Castelsardo TaxID=1851204 RepID=UPI000839A7AC|nr:hypothetical protein [Oceanobacillus sp. Castelsardo]